MNILITGGAGFIGSNLAEYYLNKNHIVHVIDDLSTGSMENTHDLLKNANFHLIKADLLTYKKLTEIVQEADCIYHFAAVVGVFRVLQEPETALNVNIGATKCLLQAIKSSNKNPRVIIASTSEVYGHNSNGLLFSEDSDLIINDNSLIRTSYAVSKIAAESYAMAYYKQFNIPITILRLFNIIGPKQTGRYGMVVPRFIKSALTNQPLTVYGTGEQRRSFTDIRDANVLFEQIANNKQTIGEIINLGNNNDISINELAKLVIKLTNSQSEIKHISYEEAYGEEFHDFMHRKPNLTKLQELTNYKYTWDLEKTINYLIDLARLKLL